MGKPSKLLHTRTWLTVSEAAEYLAQVFDENVTARDVSRYALNGHLRLSVYFVNGARGLFVKTRRKGASILWEPDGLVAVARFVPGVLLDLLLLGLDRWQVAREFAAQTGGPDLHPVNKGCDAWLVESDDGKQFVLLEGEPRSWENDDSIRASDCVPIQSLPDDGVLVVRPDALEELVRWLSEQLDKALPKQPTVESTEVVSEQTARTGGPQMVGGPRLATWLAAEMQSRDHMAAHRLNVLSRLDRKTIKKILSGKPVRELCLRKLADGLSAEGPQVLVSDIPTD